MPRHLTGDAHEWINEIPTVPTHSLANLQPSQRSWVYLCVITFDVTWFEFFRQGFFVFYNKLCYEQQRGKKTLLSLTLICYCHLVGMAKIVRGSTFVRPWNTATWRFGWLTVQSWHCLDLYYKLTCTLSNGSLTLKTALDRPFVHLCSGRCFAVPWCVALWVWLSLCTLFSVVSPLWSVLSIWVALLWLAAQVSFASPGAAFVSL